MINIKYDKDASRMIAGIAILLMLCHHFFGFESYLAEGVSWTSILKIGDFKCERIPASFGKLCVAIFAFNSGYALWINKNKPTKIAKRILKFLIDYWIVMAFFLVLALFTSSPLPSISIILENLVGLATGPLEPYVNVAFAWYVTYYVFFVIVSPLLLLLFKNKRSWERSKDIALWIAITTLIEVICADFLSLNFMGPLSLSMTGILIAKYKVFEKVHILKINRCVTAICIGGGILCLMALRSLIILYTIIPASIYDSIIAPIFIICCMNILNALSKYRWIGEAFAFLGAISMNIWYLHGLYFTTLPFNWILYWPNYSPLVYIWGVALLIPIALFFNKIQKCVNRHLCFQS